MSLREINWESARRMWLIPAIILGIQFPLVFEHLRNLWSQPHYQFFPFVLAAVAVFSVKRWEPTRNPGERYLPGQLAFLVCGLVVFGMALRINSPWLGTVGAILTAGCCFLRAAGPFNARGLMACWALLWLLLPLPMGYDEWIRQTMQANCSYVSSRILDFFHVNHLMYGNVLEAHGQRYFVDQACSGMQSLISMTVMVAIYVVSTRRSILASFGLMAMVSIACFVMNSIRITAVILLDPMTSIDLSTGWGHELLGLITFIITMAMLFSADGLMMFATAPIYAPHVLQRVEQRNRLVRLWNGFFVPRTLTLKPIRNRLSADPCFAVLSGLFLMVALSGQLIAIQGRQSNGRLAANDALKAAESLTGSDLDLKAVDSNLRLVAFRGETRGRRAANGGHSRVWNVAAPVGKMTVSLDFPFVKFHDLTVCYKSQGWRVVSDQRHAEHPATSLPADAFHEVQMERAPGEFGYLVYGLFNSESKDGGDGFSSKLKSRSRPSSEPFLQAQCFVETPDHLTETERRELMTRFIACRDQLYQRVYGGDQL